MFAVTVSGSVPSEFFPKISPVLVGTDGGVGFAFSVNTIEKEGVAVFILACVLVPYGAGQRPYV